MNDIRIAAAQFEYRDGDREFNLSRIRELTRRAVDNGADILSNSWGSGGVSAVANNMSQAIQYAVDEGRDKKGALILFAAGNDYRENESFELASHNLLMGIGATTYFDTGRPNPTDLLDAQFGSTSSPRHSVTPSPRYPVTKKGDNE